MVTRKRTPKARAAVRVTGKTVAYVQSVGKSGKLSKAKPIVLTTVAVGAAPRAVAKTRRKRR